MNRLFGSSLSFGLLACLGCSQNNARSTDETSTLATSTGTTGTSVSTSTCASPNTDSTSVQTGVTATSGTPARETDTTALTEGTQTSSSTQSPNCETGVEPVTSTTTSEAPATVAPQPSGPGSLGTFTCPAGPYAALPVEAAATPEAVANVPPVDDFAAEDDQIILEGPVWLDGSLYISQINNGKAFGGFPIGPTPGASDAGAVEEDAGPPAPPPSRILKVTEAGDVTIAFADTGSNGLALDGQGFLVATDHALGSVQRLSLDAQPAVTLVSTYEDVRFNSPNDLTFGADGTLYFTDPDYQAPTPAPQAATRAYRVAPGTSTAIPIVEDRRQPNGISLSPDRKTLYVSASDGLVAYPVMADGSLGAGAAFASDVVRSSDGMVVDCAGNLYTTAGQRVTIVDALGQEVGTIDVSGGQNVTNMAFGGADHQSLYITTLGTGTSVRLFRLHTAIPGMPY